MITALILGSWCVIGSDSTLAVSSSPSSSTNLPSVKITTPHHGQQVPFGSNVVVSGISSPPPAADKKRTDCTVSVLVNALKPYKKAVATDVVKQLIILHGDIVLLPTMLR